MWTEVRGAIDWKWWFLLAFAVRSFDCCYWIELAWLSLRDSVDCYVTRRLSISTLIWPRDYSVSLTCSSWPCLSSMSSSSINLCWVRNFWSSFWWELAKSFNSLADWVLSYISRSWKSRSLSLNLSSISLYSRMAYIFSFLISSVSFSALFNLSSKSYFAFSLILH